MFLTINIKRLLSSPMFQHRVTATQAPKLSPSFPSSGSDLRGFSHRLLNKKTVVKNKIWTAGAKPGLGNQSMT